VVWPEDLRNAAIKVFDLNQSKQVGQLAAVLYVIQSTPPFAPLHIISSSKYINNCFAKKLTNWKECRWIKIPNK
jgi:ribonuclease HI